MCEIKIRKLAEDVGDEKRGPSAWSAGWCCQLGVQWER